MGTSNTLQENLVINQASTVRPAREAGCKKGRGFEGAGDEARDSTGNVKELTLQTLDSRVQR